MSSLKPAIAIMCACASMALASKQAAFAQSPGWVSQADGLITYQGNSHLSGAGDFSASRAFLRAGSIYRTGTGTSIGFSASLGQFEYEFESTAAQPWTGIRDVRLSVPMRFQVGENAQVFVSPQVRWDYERGARASEGLTYGVFAGVAWEISENLTIGPAFGAYTQLENNDAEVFPALLVDWQINDRWNLTTGSGLGATRGPGLTLGYKVSDALSLSLSARSERVRFRLDGTGIAPNGIGEDKSIPVVFSLEHKPNPAVSLNLFAGAEFDGRLTLEDTNGFEISRQEYDTAPLVGLAFRVRF